ncbi:MAG TPA: hypothetical protein VNT81_02450 [Vicinamibacterales bacterium]|nr:hypothetical protein [Vicinamibacterales bacterium]
MKNAHQALSLFISFAQLTTGFFIALAQLTTRFFIALAQLAAGFFIALANQLSSGLEFLTHLCAERLQSLDAFCQGVTCHPTTLPSSADPGKMVETATVHRLAIADLSPV